MKAQLSSKDLIQISAYLDGELSEREKANFEKRLQKEDSLKSALKDMRYTKKLIRTLPAQKAPYNFTITQSMAESLSNPFRQLIRVFSYTSAASFFVAIVLLFMNLTPNLMRMSTAAPMAYDTAAEIQEKAVEEAEAPEIILWSEPQAYGKGGGQDPMPQLAAPLEEMESVTILEDGTEESVYESEIIEEESVMAEAEMAEESEPAAGAEIMQEPETAETQAEDNGQNREAVPSPSATLGPEMPTAESFNPILGLPSDEAAEINQMPAEETPIQTQQKIHKINWFLISEVSLVVIAALSAVLALWFRKKS